MSDADIYTCPTCGMVCDVCGCPSEPPLERAILTDLIAELRAGHPIYGDEPPLWIRVAIDRAEAHLRAITHGDTPTTQANPNHDTPPTITP